MNTPDQFQLLYRSKIEPTGEMLYRANPINFDINFDINGIVDYNDHITSEREIAIKMPESEYNRFLQNWNQYMTIMQVAHENPMVRDQYHQLLTFATLVK